MAIDVAVTTQCDRCKRKEQVVISSDKVAEYEAKKEAEKAQQQAVIEFVEKNKGKLPDLVVIFKGKAQMLSNVCDAYCAKTVQNNLDILFREAKPRKPRKKKDTTAKDADKKDDKKDKGKGDKAA